MRSNPAMRKVVIVLFLKSLDPQGMRIGAQSNHLFPGANHRFPRARILGLVLQLSFLLGAVLFPYTKNLKRHRLDAKKPMQNCNEIPEMNKVPVCWTANYY